MCNNKQKLIEASADLFHRKGYAGTSLDDILSETGIARSNFYYHFESKLSIAREVASHWVLQYDRSIVEPSLGRTQDPPVQRLVTLFRLAAETQDPGSGRTGCPLGRLSTDLATADEAIRRQIDLYFKGLKRRLTELVREIRPAATTAEAEHLAEVALCLLEGGLLLSNLRGTPDRISPAADAFLKLMACPTDVAQPPGQMAV